MEDYIYLFKTWQIEYKGHLVKIDHGWFRGSKLIVDNELQDEDAGILTIRNRLSGRIKTGDGKNESIKANVSSGWFSTHCNIFIDDKLIFSDK